jgi:hypothetical protein
MPLQNRVTPLGDLIAHPARGLVYGNRGCLHDEDGRIRRRYNGKRWIACRLEFRGWHRSPLMQPGRFTELFFLDEATALAAGHRPCAECRRDDYRRWQAAWPGEDTSADAMDRALHADRLDGSGRRRFGERLGALPDGVLVDRGGHAFLLHAGALRAWSATGYGPPEPVPAAERVTVLTPRVTVAAIARGYAVSVHPSAM